MGSARRKAKSAGGERGGRADGDSLLGQKRRSKDDDGSCDGGGGDALINGAGKKHVKLAVATGNVDEQKERCDGAKQSEMLGPAATTKSKKGHAAEKGEGGEPMVVCGFSSIAAPSNFSKVDPSLPASELQERFPMFLEAEACTVEVKAGQMLFLPAGWFHEVRGNNISRRKTTQLPARGGLLCSGVGARIHIIYVI